MNASKNKKDSLHSVIAIAYVDVFIRIFFQLGLNPLSITQIDQQAVAISNVQNFPAGPKKHETKLHTASQTEQGINLVQKIEPITCTPDNLSRGTRKE
jgi:hypothetical protein